MGGSERRDTIDYVPYNSIHSMQNSRKVQNTPKAGWPSLEARGRKELTSKGARGEARK